MFHSLEEKLSCVRFDFDICDVMVPILFLASLEILFDTSIYHFLMRQEVDAAQNQRSSKNISKQIWERAKKLITKTLIPESPNCALFHRPSNKAKVKNYRLEQQHDENSFGKWENSLCIVFSSWVFPMRMICAMFDNQFSSRLMPMFWFKTSLVHIQTFLFPCYGNIPFSTSLFMFFDNKLISLVNNELIKTDFFWYF